MRGSDRVRPGPGKPRLSKVDSCFHQGPDWLCAHITRDEVTFGEDDEACHESRGNLPATDIYAGRAGIPLKQRKAIRRNHAHAALAPRNRKRIMPIEDEPGISDLKTTRASQII